MSTTAAPTRRALTTVAAALAAVLGVLTLGLAPAAVLPAAGAATCTAAGGVSVVVDYREIGGSTVTACAPDGGGKSAAAIFASVGVQISYATRQPGFVCRVNGAPTSDPCVNASPANAYWGLWWANATSGSWTYSASGVGSLTVPAGGSVGWSWQQDRPSGGSVPPSVAPPVNGSASPTATATPSPTSSPTSPSGGSSSPTSPSASPTRGSGGSGGGSGGSGGSGSGSGGSTGTTSPSPSGSPSTSSASASPDASGGPLGSESPGDSGASDDPSLEPESPSDSDPSVDASEDAGASEASASGGESPSDSDPSDSDPSAAVDAGSPTVDEPARVPAALTWSVVGLLACAIVVSALLARRRRGA